MCVFAKALVLCESKIGGGNMKEMSEMNQSTNMPHHVALIMDGNGRWGENKGLNRTDGHRAGTQNLKRIVRFSKNIGVKELTVYAFSTENQNRAPKEVSFLMNLLLIFLKSELKELIQNDVCIRRIGFESGLKPEIMEAIQVAEEKSKDNRGLIFNIAFNYGSRQEILQGTQSLLKACMAGDISPDEIDEALFESHLLLPSRPDVLIRTGGEYRLSNFLLYQMAYTEFFFTDTLWPDFSEQEYYEILQAFSKRNRRFGKEGNQNES